MKKKIGIGIILLVLLLGILMSIYLFRNKTTDNFKEKETEKIIENDSRYLKIEDNGIIKDKNNDYIIYDPNKIYSERTLDEIELSKILDKDNYLIEGKLSEYIKYFFWAFPEQMHDSFTKKDIDVLVSLTLSTYGPNSVDYVQTIAKRYFGIDNYELPTGTYEIAEYGNYSIIKVDDYYIRSAVESVPYSEERNTSLELMDIKRNDNKITIYFDHIKGSERDGVCYMKDDPKEVREQCLLGYYEIELTYKPQENLLNVAKMKYTKK